MIELDFVPTRNQIFAAQVAIEYMKSIPEPIPEDIAAIAAWPEDQAADALRRKAS